MSDAVCEWKDGKLLIDAGVLVAEDAAGVPLARCDIASGGLVCDLDGDPTLPTETKIMAASATPGAFISASSPSTSKAQPPPAQP